MPEPLLPAPPLDLLGLTCAELAGELNRRHGKGMYHAAALAREVFKRGSPTPLAAPEFVRSPVLAACLAREIRGPDCRITARQEEGEVRKFATTLGDGAVIETVIIPARGRTTLCVSSQVGCRMGCRFCATGALGFSRDLTVAEIVWQVLAARFELGVPVDNLVFMGMGEPLDNFDRLMQALRVLGDPHGLGFGPRRITVSTAGHVEGIRRLAAQAPAGLHLAVSLNAADNGLRSALMPINRRYPLEVLREALASYPLPKGGVFLIEYVLLAGLNDSREQAHRLAAFLGDLPARVNVIGYNDGAGGAEVFTAPAPEDVQRFCHWLAEEKVFVRARASRGGGIRAACGQLGARVKGPGGAG
ncbi:MAG TPA: 23S rRNA (adenine(2503)-C(2))-methyltransferase RlmN [Candidatus Aminicenantes bacterium]|nr:23S rRNA (adenine(2503)-C(2))-methyltransferase RlmN [Candidatus Aminicenantes bacterium]